jgi:hypothetical protein
METEKQNKKHGDTPQLPTDELRKDGPKKKKNVVHTHSKCKYKAQS